MSAQKRAKHPIKAAAGRPGTTPILSITRSEPYMPTPRTVKMTPKLAEEILTKNTLNRPLRAGRVERYAADMSAGNWRLNGETIKITDDGQLLDGQHRLFAVIESGKTIDMLLIEGLDASVMPTIDTGAQRSFADVLAIGGGKNATAVASVFRLIAWYEARPRPTDPSSMALTHTELMKVADNNPDVPTVVPVAIGSKAKKFLPKSILAFVYLMAWRGDPGKAGAWLELLSTGANMDPKHPVHQLRERMTSNAIGKAKLPPLEVLALAVKSWNQFVTGKRTVTLRWSSAEEFPKILSGR